MKELIVEIRSCLDNVNVRNVQKIKRMVNDLEIVYDESIIIDTYYNIDDSFFVSIEELRNPKLYEHRLNKIKREEYIERIKKDISYYEDKLKSLKESLEFMTK